MSASLDWMPDSLLLPCQRSSMRDWWISDSREDRESAQRVCERCPWRNDCLNYGLAIDARAGVFGGRDFCLPEPEDGTLFEVAS